MIASVNWIAFVVIILAQQGAAQMPDLQPTRLWKSFKVTENQEVLKIVLSRDGRYFTAGNTFTKEAGSHYWVGELSKDGKKLWGKSFVAKKQEKINDIVLTDDQHLLLVGQLYFRGSQGWLVKCSLDGQQVFEKTFGTCRLTTFSNVIPAEDKCYILAGRSRSDAYLVKIDQTGNVMWERWYDHYKDVWVISGVPYQDGKFLFACLCGEFNKFGQGDSKVWTIVCDSNGKLVRDFETVGQIAPGMSTITTLGDRVFLGLSKKQMPRRDCWVLCLDARFKKQWELQFGKEEMAYPTPSIYNLPNDKLLLAWTAGGKLSLKCLSLEGKVLASQDVEGVEGLVVAQNPQSPKLFLKEIKLMP